MRDRILECHLAWLLGYGGYLLVLIVLNLTGLLGHILESTTPIQKNLIFLLIPIMGLISCLYICLKARDQDPAIAPHCQEAINFQISYTGYQVSLVLFIYWTWASQSTNPYTNNNLGTLGIMLMFSPLVPVIELCRYILTFIAVKKVARGDFYSYPITLRLWK
jgi:uncharacterized Tic20 family protein